MVAEANSLCWEDRLVVVSESPVNALENMFYINYRVVVVSESPVNALENMFYINYRVVVV